MVYHNISNKLLAFVLIEKMPDEKTKARMLDKIRVKVLSILPEHGVPDYFQILPHFPVNRHGKLCDKTLCKLYQDGQNEKCPSSPENTLIQILSVYLRTDLTNDELKKHTFTELGGNSIMTLQVLQSFEEQIGARAPDKFVTLLINQTIQECINFVALNVTMNSKRLIQKENILQVKKPKLNSTTECILWTYNLMGCVDSPPLAFLRENNTYIAASSFANRFAILRHNGQEYFTHVFPKEVAAQPVLSECGDFMFVGCTDGVMYCLDLVQKKFVWEYRTLQDIKSSACICGGVVAFGSYDQFVYGLKVLDGSLLWKTKVSGHIKADPLYDATSNSVYIGTTKGSAYCLNCVNGDVIWVRDLQQPIFGSPCLVEGRIVWVTVGGNFFVGDCDPEHKGQIKGHIFSSLKPNNRNCAAYFGSHNSNLYRLSFENDQLQIVQIIQLESEISSSPFVYEFCDKTFVICVCNTGVVFVVNTATSSVIFRKELPDASFSSPYVLDKRIYVGCRDNNLYCIDIESALINCVS